MRKKLLLVLLLMGVVASSCASTGEVAVDSTTTTVAQPATTTTLQETTTTIVTTTTVPETTTTTLPVRQNTPEAFVAGLVVSMGEPSQETVDRYAEWNANAIALWEPEEATYWTDYPAYVWVTHDGRQVNDPFTKEDPDTWQPLELPSNVFAAQVGDEPIPNCAVDSHSLFRPMPEYLGLGLTEFTNASYWTPLTCGDTDMEPRLDELWSEYQGDVVMNGEYNMSNVNNVRYVVLDYFRRLGLERNQPYWTYLNAYTGQETGYETVHSPSDLAWQAFTGVAMGYTGHVWFTYALGAGHGEFDGNDNGSIISSPGTFNETEYWDITAEINEPLLYLTRQITDQTSTDVCWSSCGLFRSSEPLLVGEFTDDYGSRSWIVLNGNHTYLGSDETANVVMPFDAVVTFPEYRVVREGDVVSIDAGWPVMIHEMTRSMSDYR